MLILKEQMNRKNRIFKRLIASKRKVKEQNQSHLNGSFPVVNS